MKSSKTILAVFVIILIANSVDAQIKGNLIVGGGSSLTMSFMKAKIDFNGESQDAGKSLSMNFAPIVGYLFTNNLAAGIELPLSLESYTGEDDDKETITSIAIAPFVRYYFGTSNVKPFLHGGIGIGSVKSKSEGEGSVTATAGLTVWQLGGGCAMFVNENISVDLGLSYGSASKNLDEDSFDYKQISSGLGADIGFVLFF